MLPRDRLGNCTFFLSAILVFLAGIGILFWILKTPPQLLKNIHIFTSPEVQSSGENLPALSQPSQSSVTSKRPLIETSATTVESLDYYALAETYFAGKPLSGFDYQGFADFTDEQGGEKIDFRQIFQEAYRDFYSNTDPETLDEAMAKRLHEVVGTLLMEGKEENKEEVMEAAFSFTSEPEVAIWFMGRFEGNIGAFVEWFTDTLQPPPLPTISEMDNSEPFYVIIQNLSELESPEVPNESKNIEVHRERIEVSDPLVTDSAAITLLPEQEFLIRDTLSHYGVDEGIFQLAETDPDVIKWILQRFNSPVELEEWLASGKGRWGHAEDRHQERSAPNVQSKEVPLEGKMLYGNDE